MRAADLDDLVELAGFAAECLVELGQGREKLPLDGFRSGNMNGGWNDVIARLSQVHVVVRVHQFAASGAAEQFGRPVRNDFVRIHVRRRARAGLKNINRKFGVQPPVNDFGRGPNDGVRRFFIEQLQRVIDGGGGALNESHRPNHGAGNA